MQLHAWTSRRFCVLSGCPKYSQVPNPAFICDVNLLRGAQRILVRQREEHRASVLASFGEGGETSRQPRFLHVTAHQCGAAYRLAWLQLRASQRRTSKKSPSLPDCLFVDLADSAFLISLRNPAAIVKALIPRQKKCQTSTSSEYPRRAVLPVAELSLMTTPTRALLQKPRNECT